MSSRPGSGGKSSTGGHRRSDSGGHHRHSSSGSAHNRSDSGQSIDSSEYHHHHRKHGHHRSKSGVHERERTESGSSQLSNRLEFRSSQVINDSQQQPYPRPTSLYPLKSQDAIVLGQETLQPEREPIKFDVNLVGAPPEVEQLVNNIKQVAEQFLYHWKMFPIILPSPVAQTDSFPTSNVTSDGSLGRAKCKYHLRDLFVTPSFDELDAVAVDSKGETRKLTGKQLEYIRERG